MASWLCSVCTFANDELLPHCEMCGTERPAPKAAAAAPVGGRLPRTPSALLSEALGFVTRQQARWAIDAAGGDISLAASNLFNDGAEPAAAAAAAGADDEVLVVDDDDVRIVAETYEPLRRPRGDVDCPVCFLPAKRADAVALACGHAYCTACLRAHVQARMAEGDAVVIRCPQAAPPADGDDGDDDDIGMGTGAAAAASSSAAAAPPDTCRYALSQRELRALLGAEAFSVLDRRALETAAARDPSLFNCPTPDCTMIVDWAGPTAGDPCIDCPVCKQQRCLVCGASPYHTGSGCTAAPLRLGMAPYVPPKVVPVPGFAWPTPPTAALPSAVASPYSAASSSSSSAAAAAGRSGAAAPGSAAAAFPYPPAGPAALRYPPSSAASAMAPSRAGSAAGAYPAGGPYGLAAYAPGLPAAPPPPAAGPASAASSSSSSSPFGAVYAAGSAIGGAVAAMGAAVAAAVAGGSGGAAAAPAVDSALAAFMERSNIKICKRCRQGVVKEVGCDKVKCRCGYRFCWVCGSENAQCSWCVRAGVRHARWCPLLLLLLLLRASLPVRTFTPCPPLALS